MVKCGSTRKSAHRTLWAFVRCSAHGHFFARLWYIHGTPRMHQHMVGEHYDRVNTMTGKKNSVGKGGFHGNHMNQVGFVTASCYTEGRHNGGGGITVNFAMLSLECIKQAILILLVAQDFFIKHCPPSVYWWQI